MKSIYHNKTRLIVIIALIAIASILIQLLGFSRYDKTALLYIGIPFFIASSLVLLRNTDESPNWRQTYSNFVIDSCIIMFVVSIILLEGAICILMFFPIYLIVIIVVFIIHAILRKTSNKKDRLGISILPIIVIFSAFEGVTPSLSYDRIETVEVTQVINRSVDEIMLNLTKPIELEKSRHWFLEIFPMPHLVSAGSMNEGDVHAIHFKYYRWFVTNLHEGRMLLEITSNKDNSIQTTFLDDTSYISNYMNLKGTEIIFDEIDSQTTQVSLKVTFERTLDPYWYFSPLERFGVEKTSELIIKEIFSR